MPQMDDDAKQVMDFLIAAAPLPTRDTVAADYRRVQEEGLAARQVEPLPLTRIETFEVDGEGGKIRIRLYIDGDDPAPRPALIYMHGGGFVTCSIESHDHYCRRLAQETGLAIVSVDYRLAPEHPYPAGFEDCRDVLLWVAGADATARGIDGSRIAVGGDSAGGAFAAALCLWARDNAGPEIAHQVLIYPVIDNDFTTASYSENATDYFLTTEAMQWFWEQFVCESDRIAASPSRTESLCDLPRAVVVTAEYDVLRDEGTAYAKQLSAGGNEVDHWRIEGMLHGFVHFAGVFDPGIEVARQLGTLIGQHFGTR